MCENECESVSVVCECVVPECVVGLVCDSSRLCPPDTVVIPGTVCVCIEVLCVNIVCVSVLCVSVWQLPALLSSQVHVYVCVYRSIMCEYCVCECNVCECVVCECVVCECIASPSTVVIPGTMCVCAYRGIVRENGCEYCVCECVVCECVTAEKVRERRME